MTNETTTPTPDNDETQTFAGGMDLRLAEILDQYMNAAAAGEAPDRDELLAKYPDLADQLKECLAGIDFVQNSPAPDAPRQLGDFRIIREVGSGGMGVVYEAEQLSLHRQVALKVLRHAVADPDAILGATPTPIPKAPDQIDNRIRVMVQLVF